VEQKQGIDNSESMLIMKLCNFPEGISEGIFKESGDVLECSPSLGRVSWFLGVINKLSEISISFLSEGSILINVK